MHRLETLIAALVSCGVLTEKVARSATRQRLIPTSFQGPQRILGTIIDFQIGGQIYGMMEHLDAGLTGNETALAHQRMSGWLSDPQRADDFSRAQHAGSLGPAIMMSKRLDLSDARNLLDVAGGTGAYSIVFCQRNPALRATILDFPTVINVARRYVDKAGLSDRISLLAGDARETEWPDKQDVVLMSYLLSAVDGGAIAQLMERAFAALLPGGRVLIHDFMLNDDRPARVLQLSFSSTTSRMPLMRSHLPQANLHR